MFPRNHSILHFGLWFRVEYSQNFSRCWASFLGSKIDVHVGKLQKRLNEKRERSQSRMMQQCKDTKIGTGGGEARDEYSFLIFSPNSTMFLTFLSLYISKIIILFPNFQIFFFQICKFVFVVLFKVKFLELFFENIFFSSLRIWFFLSYLVLLVIFSHWWRHWWKYSPLSNSPFSSRFLRILVFSSLLFADFESSCIWMRVSLQKCTVFQLLTASVTFQWRRMIIGLCQIGISDKLFCFGKLCFTIELQKDLSGFVEKDKLYSSRIGTKLDKQRPNSALSFRIGVGQHGWCFDLFFFTKNVKIH